MELRRMKAEDIDELIKMRKAQQAEIYGMSNVYKGFNEDIRVYFEKALTNEDSITIICEKNGEIVATGTFNIERQPPQCIDNGIYAYMCNIYTKPMFRELGYQKKIYEYAIAVLKDKGVSTVYFDSLVENFIRSAKKKGFVARNDYYSLDL